MVSLVQRQQSLERRKQASFLSFWLRRSWSRFDRGGDFRHAVLHFLFDADDLGVSTARAASWSSAATVAVVSMSVATQVQSEAAWASTSTAFDHAAVITSAHGVVAAAWHRRLNFAAAGRLREPVVAGVQLGTATADVTVCTVVAPQIAAAASAAKSHRDSGTDVLQTHWSGENGGKRCLRGTADGEVVWLVQT